MSTRFYRSRSARGGAALAGLLWAALLTAGCSSIPASESGGGPGPVGPAPCPMAAAAGPAQPAAANAGGGDSGGVELTMAARLAARVVVDSPTAAPNHCRTLVPGSIAILTTGDRVRFVANQVPDIAPPGSKVVSVSTTPAPSQPGAGGFPTSHVTVTLTAVGPGQVSITWIDCSGVAC